ncbi:hypothetical protein Ahy_B09g098650 [Arachis hypogaea]|uniref:Uncharacterized protein n=1 Tax=Arachis hypogaea TaxID=3818 RepID=A0A444XRU0_ARAHY|nr:hypothetical protein Ahy_B09g098650 [Arachis hypogaea]
MWLSMCIPIGVNSDNGMIFEYDNLLLFRTQPVNPLSELKSLILNNLGGLGRKEIGRLGYKLLALLGFCTGNARQGLGALCSASPHLIPVLLDVPSHYHALDLDAMHEKSPFSNTGKDDYNLDGGVEFRVGHRFKSRDAVMQGVKNYSIRRSVEYRVVESDLF